MSQYHPNFKPLMQNRNKRNIHFNLTERIRTWHIFLAFIGILSIPIASLCFHYFRFAEPSQSGQIGDTIGGISAPFVNLIAALLVFYSFREQLRANKQLEDLSLRQIREGEIRFLLELIFRLEKKEDEFREDMLAEPEDPNCNTFKRNPEAIKSVILKQREITHLLIKIEHSIIDEANRDWIQIQMIDVFKGKYQQCFEIALEYLESYAEYGANAQEIKQVKELFDRLWKLEERLVVSQPVDQEPHLHELYEHK